MFRITVKGIFTHRLRFALTALAVCLGVTLVAGTLVLSGSITNTFDAIVEQTTAGTDVQVRGAELETTTVDGTKQREPLPLSLEQKLDAVDGVAWASADVGGTAVLVGADGTAARNGGAPNLGFAYTGDDPSVQMYEGRGPEKKGEIAVDESTLDLSGLKVGDTTRALIQNDPQDVTVTGVFTYGSSLAGATLVLLDEKTALATWAPDGEVSSFTIGADDGVDQETLRDRVAQVVPAGTEVVTGETVYQEQKDAFGTAIGFITTFLLVFALIAVFVGAFIIANTFSMLVAQRTRELALLRAVGASRGQVLRVVLGEAAILGLTGSVIGLGLGMLLAAGLRALVKQAGLEVTGGLPVTATTVLVSLLVGLVVTMLSAVFPALRAARVAPIAALRDDAQTPPGGVLRRGVIGLVLVLLGFGAVLPGSLGDEPNWPLVGVGAALLLIGLLVAAPWLTRPVVRLISLPYTAIYGTVGRLARENALRNPRRTATTASALMIGLALMSSVGVFASSANASVSDIVDSELTADYVLSSGGFTQLPTTVADEVQKMPGVTSVATIRSAPLRVNGASKFTIAADPRAMSENVKLNVTAGSLDSLNSGDVVISRSAADDEGWKLGDRLTAEIGTETGEELTVGAIIDDSQALNNPSLIIPLALYADTVPTAQQGDFMLYVKSDGTNTAALRSQIEEVVKPFLVVSVQDGEEYAKAQAAQINSLLYLIYALLALSVLIAVLGIINTLALSVFERTREIGLLRAVGMSRRQLRRMISAESVSTAVFGAVLGMGLGLVLGLVLQRALVSQGLETLSIPWLTLVIVLLFSAVAGMVAAIMPAWRAVRLDVLRAITAD
ncbi:FtsX-like permease family protein [Kineosporia sp. J2-2]|uniref:FtsX-like permease family protein n=1 Tax=Kineosporia corallincola TaxID=2835133 RepID=A0ABS5TLE6_9ACTN|nr:FtsX-like permease family protein [Kineosporia corallincola]MBT0771927.1 FtsX-like permease family protein [Kineosporia corallincola]